MASPTLSPHQIDRAVRLFADHRECFIRLANALEDGLRTRCRELGLHALTQSRAKDVASFAEKLIRKQEKYSDPLRDPSDLCAARVILNTLADVARLWESLRQNCPWVVVTGDSVDKGEELLRANQFGYQSRHLVVELPAEMMADLPDAFTPVRAEIQIRTVLQHAWADIDHSLRYKVPIQPPADIARRLTRLAAVVEGADQEFDRLQPDIDEYAAGGVPYRTVPELREELARLRHLHALAPGPDLAHRLAAVAMALGLWDEAVRALDACESAPTAPRLRDLGISLTKLRAADTDSPDYLRGLDRLRRGAEMAHDDVDAWASLGGAWRRRELAARTESARREAREQAVRAYRRAWECRPGHPYSLGNYMEYLAGDHPDLDIPQFFGPSLDAARRVCERQAGMNLNLPWALFDLGKFTLLSDREADPARDRRAVRDYARGVARATSAAQVESALSSFANLRRLAEGRPGFALARRVLELALARPAGPPPAGGVAVVAGFCNRPGTGEERGLFLAAFEAFEGTVISGGTAAGVCELVGDVQAANPRVRSLGYVPRSSPHGVVPDRRYSQHLATEGEDYSILEPLRYWADLFARGVPPEAVRLLCAGGGELSRLECELALALGASVGLLPAASAPIAELAADPFWEPERKAGRLVPLEFAAPRVRAFLIGQPESCP